MNRIQYAILFFVFTVGLYLGLTWFFFGSPHPCGILEAMERPYVLEEAERDKMELLDLYKMLSEKTKPRSRIEANDIQEEKEKWMKMIGETEEQALKALNQRVWWQTPAQCFWQAITWKAPLPTVATGLSTEP